LEKEHDRKWAKDQNVHIENKRREWRAQGEDGADEIPSWKIEGVEEDGWSLGIYRKKMDKNIVSLQTTAKGLE